MYVCMYVCTQMHCVLEGAVDDADERMREDGWDKDTCAACRERRMTGVCDRDAILLPTSLLCRICVNLSISR